jgi:soluble lytic murein transglycosylase-like protein
MRKVGGIFVGTFLLVGAAQAITGFVPAAPSAANELPAQRVGDAQDAKFTGSSAPIRAGSVPNKRWEELIDKWGNKCKALTPAILAAQLHQESMGFNPRVVSGQRNSPVGARGIAQFMPGTWADHGVDANKDGKRDIIDPEDAIPSAAVYDCKVARSVRHVSGNVTDNMLAGYNAGSGAVLKYGGIPPYSETQNYVRIIKKKAGRFER